MSFCFARQAISTQPCPNAEKVGFRLVFVVGKVDASMFKTFRFLFRKNGRGKVIQSLVLKRLCGNLACHGTPTTQGIIFCPSMQCRFVI
jgi:hypothetical protein